MSLFDLFKEKRLKLHDVEMRISNSTALRSPAELRNKVDIVAIDDNDFHPETNLRNAGFNIKSIRDIQLISDVEPFSIILCDLNGVGTSLSTDTQGAYVIEEIKSRYPEKIVIAYTANPSTSRLAKRARIAADGYIKKDDSIEEWRDLLDNKIRYISNPIEAWKQLRLRLLARGIELSDLLRLEQIVLKNIDKGVATTRGALEKELKSTDAMSPWKNDLVKFIGSKAFDLAFSAVKSQITANP